MSLQLFFIVCSTIMMSGKPAGEYVYRYTDSSVPPQYHRSYTITVKPTEVQLVVDSYGNVLLDEKYSITAKQFKSFVSGLNSCHLSEQAAPETGDGCTGGTGESFTLNKGKGKVVKGSLEHCGGKTSGSISGDTEKAAGLFRGIVPDFGTKLESTREK